MKKIDTIILDGKNYDVIKDGDRVYIKDCPKHIGGDADFRGSQVTDLSSLESIGGDSKHFYGLMKHDYIS